MRPSPLTHAPTVGKNNKNCLCETCERLVAGGYRVRADGEVSDADERSDVEPPSRSGSRAPPQDMNVNERRTRRGVYAVLSEEEDQEEDQEDPVEAPQDAIKVEVEESRVASALSSLSPSPMNAAATGLITPSPDPEAPPSAEPVRKPRFEPVIATRAQRRAAELAKAVPAPLTPPLSDDAATPMRTRSRSRTSTPAAGARASSIAAVKTALRRSASAAARGASASAVTRTASLKAVTRAASASVLRGGVSGKGKGRANIRDIEVDLPKIKRSKEKAEPQCATCGSVLPVISIEHEVVWGDFEGRGRRAKKEEHECPRCACFPPRLHREF
jgi:histone-lysine N-methyltransferase SUV420H